MNRRATQQCNMSPYVYAVYWLPPASSAFLLARKCNWLAEKMLITCVMRHARLQKLQRFRRKMPLYSFLILCRCHELIDFGLAHGDDWEGKGDEGSAIESWIFFPFLTFSSKSEKSRWQVVSTLVVPQTAFNHCQWKIYGLESLRFCPFLWKFVHFHSEWTRCFSW